MKNQRQPEAVEPENSVGTAIQRDIGSLHKKHFGRGPVKTKLYLHEDSLLLLMREGHTVTEEILHQAGGDRAVAQGRVDLSEALRAQFIQIVELHTGRKVVGFMSSSQQDPDLLCHVYVLAPTDLLHLVEDPSAARPG